MSIFHVVTFYTVVTKLFADKFRGDLVLELLNLSDKLLFSFNRVLLAFIGSLINGCILIYRVLYLRIIVQLCRVDLWLRALLYIGLINDLLLYRFLLHYFFLRLFLYLLLRSCLVNLL